MIWKTAPCTAGTGRFLRRGIPFPRAKPLPCNFRLCRKAARVKIGEGGWRRSIRRTLRFRQRRGCHAQIEHLGHGTRRGRYPRPPACQKPQDGARRAGALPRVHHPRVRMAGAGGFLRRGKAVPLLPPPGNPHGFQRGLVGWPWQGAGTPSARLPKTSWIPQAGRWRIGRRESLQATGTGLQQMALAWALAAGCKCSWRRKRKLPPGPSLSGEAILRLRALSAQKLPPQATRWQFFATALPFGIGETGAGSGAQNHGSISGMRGKASKRPMP